MVTQRFCLINCTPKTLMCFRFLEKTLPGSYWRIAKSHSPLKILADVYVENIQGDKLSTSTNMHRTIVQLLTCARAHTHTTYCTALPTAVASKCIRIKGSFQCTVTQCETCLREIRRCTIPALVTSHVGNVKPM